MLLEKTDFKTAEKVEKLFDKMNDMEVFDCIRENKVQYIAVKATVLTLSMTFGLSLKLPRNAWQWRNRWLRG